MSDEKLVDLNTSSYELTESFKFVTDCARTKPHFFSASVSSNHVLYLEPLTPVKRYYENCLRERSR